MLRKRAQKCIRSWDSHDQRPNESLHGTVAKASAREHNTLSRRNGIEWVIRGAEDLILLSMI